MIGLGSDKKIWANSFQFIHQALQFKLERAKMNPQISPFCLETLFCQWNIQGMFAMGNWNADTQIFSNLPCHRNTAAQKKNFNFKFGYNSFQLIKRVFFLYCEWLYVEVQCLLKKRHIFSSFTIWASPRWEIDIFVLSFRNRSTVWGRRAEWSV